MPEAEKIQQGDPLICFNFRKDRPRQLLSALDCSFFDSFERDNAPRANVTCLMLYDHMLGMQYAFEHDVPEITLAEILSDAGIRHFHCAETEKFAHVTYFFNGGGDNPLPGETRKLLPSPRVATYDLQPEMSAGAVADAVVDAIRSDEYPFIVVNFANGDMVGHTAVEDAVIRAVEALDREVGRVLQAASDAGYSIILTADHGNCEEMVDPTTGEPHTQHTTYPVPCMVADEQVWRLSTSGGLANIAPTVLQLMGLPIPASMSSSLLLEVLAVVRRENRQTPNTDQPIKSVA
jgi:2,3-bisphosphoglycerate-independent phosphoglycerate mutase